MMKKLGLLTFLALVAFLVGCQEAELHNANDSTQSMKQSDLLVALEQKHPDYFKSIAIYGTDDAGTMLLFLAERGGTYIFRKESGEVELINHAKAIIPSMITKVTFSENVFNLWAENRNELSIRVSE